MIHLENWSFKLNVILKLWKSGRKLNVDGHEVKRIRKKGKKGFGNCGCGIGYLKNKRQLIKRINLEIGMNDELSI